jgi:hypothetical protein
MPAFLNVLFLAGLAGAAVPLIIHLLDREKPTRVEFGWLRFVERAHQSQERRFRIRELLVLLMRMLLCALLALAFARPFFSGAGANATMVQLPHYAAVVVDISYSMRGKGWWEEAREKALEIVDGLESGSQVSLLTAGAQVRMTVPWTEDREAVRAAVRKLEPTFEATDLGSAFRAAEEMLRAATGAGKTLYVISDHQATGWQRLDRGDRAGPGIAVHLEMVGAGERENCGVGKVRVRKRADLGDSVAVGVRVRQFGVRDRRDVRVRLVVEEKLIGEQKVDIDGGGEVDVEFAVEDGEGARAGWVELEEDLLSVDDRRYFVLPPRQRFRVLCVDGERMDGQGASYFLRRALNPWEEERGAVVGPRVIGPRQLSAAVVEGMDAVFLCDTGNLDSGTIGLLEEFVRKGGGLVAAAGARGRMATGALFSAGTGKVRRIPESEGFAVFTDLDYGHPIFAPFRTARHGDFGAVRIFAYRELGEAEGDRILMRFDDGAPALVERSLGMGKVLICATSFDASWTDLPKRGIFPPFIHQALRYLKDALGEEERTDFRVGERPDSEGEPMRAPGIFQLPTSAGIRPVAVNVDGNEGDLGTIDLEGLRERLAPLKEAEPIDPMREVVEEAREVEREQKAWWFLMIGVLVLAVGEMLLANRT